MFEEFLFRGEVGVQEGDEDDCEGEDGHPDGLAGYEVAEHRAHHRADGEEELIHDPVSRAAERVQARPAQQQHEDEEDYHPVALIVHELGVRPVRDAGEEHL